MVYHLRPRGVGRVRLVLTRQPRAVGLAATDIAVGLGLKYLGPGNLVQVKVFGLSLDASEPDRAPKAHLQQVQ